jgi:hypothetical protein
LVWVRDGSGVGGGDAERDGLPGVVGGEDEGVFSEELGGFAFEKEGRERC